MKKLYKLFLGLMIVGSAANAQTIFQSNLSSWAGGEPTDWMGSASNVSILEEVAADTYGSSAAKIGYTSTSGHKRFTTKNIEVTAGETYEIKMWVKAASGKIRTSYYNVTTSGWGSYNDYVDLSTESAGSLVELSQTVSLAGTCDSAQFILSINSTDGVNDIVVDSVAISVSAPPSGTPLTIYQIQNTTTAPYDSPYDGQLVETSGVVTAVKSNGYYLQDGNGAWNGIFVLDYDNTPNVGDIVELTATVDEYYDYTTVENLVSYNVTGTGTLPTPVLLSTLAANDEMYEGVLVRVTNAPCVADTATNGNGEWTVDDGSGELIVDDKMLDYNGIVSTAYNVTGIIDYSYSNFKLLPREAGDVEVYTSIEEINNITVSVYPSPASTFVAFELSDNNFEVKIFDITGKVVKNIYSTKNRVNVSVSELDNGVYFYSLYTQKGNLIKTNKFVVNK